VSATARFERLVDHLQGAGLREVELYRKTGQSRRVEIGPQGLTEVRSQEAGWAVRASGRKGSFFASGTGEPEVRGPWPVATGEPLQLPAAMEAEPILQPEQAPLHVETEAMRRLETFERELGQELVDARLTHAILDDGASEVSLMSSRGVEVEHHQRAAHLYLEVTTGGSAPVRRAHRLAARSAAEIDFAALARRLGVLLTVLRDGDRLQSGDGDMVLAPAAAARLLAGLLPLLVGPEAWPAARALSDRRGRLGSQNLTVIDDARLPRGVLSAPVDGEGMPTREMTLVDEGHYVQPLLSWREVEPGVARPCGCSRRPSWREPPEPSPSHLFIAPHAETSPAALIGSVERGYYWLDASGPPRVDLAADRFALPVCGFGLRQGRASEPISSAVVAGTVSGLLSGIRGVGRDLSFLPLGHLSGAPTLLIEGLALDGRAQPG
jgi:PmbA protein